MPFQTSQTPTRHPPHPRHTSIGGIGGVTLLMLVTMALATAPTVAAKAPAAVGERIRIVESRLPRESGEQTFTQSLRARKDASNHQTRPGVAIAPAAYRNPTTSQVLIAATRSVREQPLTSAFIREALLNLPPPIQA